MDRNGEEIELCDDDDDEYAHGFRDVENEKGSYSDNEFENAGYAVEDAEDALDGADDDEDEDEEGDGAFDLLDGFEDEDDAFDEEDEV